MQKQKVWPGDEASLHSSNSSVSLFPPQDYYFKKHTLNALPDVALKDVDRWDIHTAYYCTLLLTAFLFLLQFMEGRVRGGSAQPVQVRTVCTIVLGCSPFCCSLASFPPAFRCLQYGSASGRGPGTFECCQGRKTRLRCTGTQNSKMSKSIR